MTSSRHWFMGLAPLTAAERRQAATEAMYERDERELYELGRCDHWEAC